MRHQQFVSLHLQQHREAKESEHIFRVSQPHWNSKALFFLWHMSPYSHAKTFMFSCAV